MKYLDTADLLETRIRRGDYITRKLPVEGEIAREFSISRVTVRKVIATLIERGVLVRPPNMGIRVSAEHEKKRKTLCFLTTAYPCSQMEVYLAMLERAAAAHQAGIRTAHYVHWGDPAIKEALDSFDGIFLWPLCEEIPAATRQMLRGARARVAIFDYNLAEDGIPSIFPYPPRLVFRMLDHLYGLGHRRIVGINTQPHEALIEERLKQWLLWQKTRGLELRMIDRPVRPYEQSWAAAHRLVRDELDNGALDATALLCTTESTALGATRALFEKGLRTGKDISVCAVNDDGTSRYLCPSLTCFTMPDDLAGHLRLCVEWMLGLSEHWLGAMEFQSAQDTLFVGESVCEAGVFPEKEGRHE